MVPSRGTRSYQLSVWARLMPYCHHSLLCVCISLPRIARGTPLVSETNTARKPPSAPANSHPRGIIPFPGDQSALRTLPRQPIQTNTRCSVQLLLLAPRRFRVKPGAWLAGGSARLPLKLDAFPLVATCSGSTPIGWLRPLPRRAGKLRKLERVSVAGSGESSPARRL